MSEHTDCQHGIPCVSPYGFPPMRAFRDVFFFQGSKEKILLVHAHESRQVLDVSSSLGNENRSSNYESSSSGNENKSSDYESNSSRNNADAKKMLVDTTAFDIENDDIRTSYEYDTVSDVHPNIFEIMFAHG
ncbi:hypothetical protein Tco_1479245, partial [Tanacetum coccineum]